MQKVPSSSSSSSCASLADVLCATFGFPLAQHVENFPALSNRTSKRHHNDEHIIMQHQQQFPAADALQIGMGAKGVRQLLSELNPDQIAYLREHVVTVQTQAQVDEIASAEQGTTTWKRHRENRLTASNFGKSTRLFQGGVAGEGSGEDPDKLAASMVFSTFKGNTATRYGNRMEDTACDQFVQECRAELRSMLATSPAGQREHAYRGIGFVLPRGETSATITDHRLFRVEHTGLRVDPHEPWRAGSVDGLVFLMDRLVAVLEIKCPYAKIVYEGTPVSYYDQCQGNMDILDLDVCFFYVWTPKPKETYISMLHYNEAYCEQRLRPAIRIFFFRHLLPQMMLRHERRRTTAYEQMMMTSSTNSPTRKRKSKQEDEKKETKQRPKKKQKKEVLLLTTTTTTTIT